MKTLPLVCYKRGIYGHGNDRCGTNREKDSDQGHVNVSPFGEAVMDVAAQTLEK